MFVVFHSVLALVVNVLKAVCDSNDDALTTTTTSEMVNELPN